MAAGVQGACIVALDSIISGNAGNGAVALDTGRIQIEGGRIASHKSAGCVASAGGHVSAHGTVALCCTCLYP